MPPLHQIHVPVFLPDEGLVYAIIFGEAPGPRGADQSGIPFWGDRAGLPVYRALAAAGLAELPPGALADWDGAALRAAGRVPRLKGVALSNACPVCPSSDGQHFRAPSDRELLHPDNLARVRGELALAGDRGLKLILALGRRAAWLMERIEPPFPVQRLPHPSAQGLLQAAPGKGKGLRLADLEDAWEQGLASLLAGLVSNDLHNS